MLRPVALITGASSGIGAAYARRLAHQCDFVLVARRAERLRAVAVEVRAAGAVVDVLPADLGTTDGLAAVTDRLALGDIRFLVSSAGTCGYARLVDLDPSRVARLLMLDAVAPVQLVRAALPGMLAANEGTVVTVASLLAFSAGHPADGMPPRSVYAAAKAATVAFTRTLAGELAGTAIKAQVVCPGVVATAFNSGYGNYPPYGMPADGVAAASLAGLRLGESICVPGLADAAAALDALLAVETTLLADGNRAEPAPRYDYALPNSRAAG